MEINDLLKKAAGAGASDLHIKVGNSPIFRVNGSLRIMESEPRITKDEAIKHVLSVMNPAQKEAFKKEADLDFAYSVPGLGRFRCNAFLQRGTVGIVFRVIPTVIPNVDDLMLPPVLKNIALEERGLVLVTGTTGSGKSTTLAAMIDHINVMKTANIVTIEDPVEYLHRDKKSIVNQREVGADTKSFSKALRAALRQDPDVILVGEMRDFDTIQTALMAAETGHLVLSTLHTLDAPETINRIISFFPPYHQQQVRIQLASVLKGIISERLVPKADGKGRVPAVEVLMSTATIRDCITDSNKTKMLTDFIAQGKLHYGMQTFDQSLLELYQNGLVTYEEALKQASNPDDFALKVKGVNNTAEMFEQKQSKDGGGPMIERFAR
ncbi:MAG: type IV pilus twitching motility protein PilT [Nitrospiraceae bacterium]|nr:type IV pilus twitching motility protein PilT [Nitrospiraceae bacterium]